MRLFLSALLIAGLAGTSHADIIFDIEDVVVTPGQQAVVGVFVRATAGETLTSYNLPIDIGNDGYGTPGTLTFAGAADVNPISTVVVSGTAQLPSPPFVQNYEAVFSDSGLPIAPPNTTTGGRHLFNILVNTTAGFSGTTPLSITSNNVPTQFNVVSSAGTFTAPNGGTLRVVGGSISAVPEPNALVALGLVGGLAGFRRRRA